VNRQRGYAFEIGSLKHSQVAAGPSLTRDAGLDASILDILPMRDLNHRTSFHGAPHGRRIRLDFVKWAADLPSTGSVRVILWARQQYRAGDLFFFLLHGFRLSPAEPCNQQSAAAGAEYIRITSLLLGMYRPVSRRWSRDAARLACVHDLSTIVPLST